MPVNYKKDQMAEYVNRAIAVNDRLRKRDSFFQPAEALDLIISRIVNMQNVDVRMAAGNEAKNDEKNLDSCISDSEEMKSPIHNQTDSTDAVKQKYAYNSSKESKSLIVSRTAQVPINQPQVPSNDSILYFLPIDYSKRNPWRRIIGLHVSGIELQSSTYPARSSVKKLRFAQAKKPLNYMYSYFSVEMVDCDEKSSIMIGISRKDYPSKIPPGKAAGSIGYCSDTGSVFLRDVVQLKGHQFSKGDVVGCGIIYPSHYKRYVDLSTDDNSDGMTDVVLTSILSKKSMDFVRNVLNLSDLKDAESDSDSSCKESQLQAKSNDSDSDYYNENFVESRTQVEVYFTHNMQVIGKVMAHIPIGGFYPTIHIFSCSAIKMNVDMNPPTS